MLKNLATVFIVDDDTSVRKAVSRLVRSHGYKVETCATAQEFLSHETSDGAACVVLDIHLPDLDGLSVQEKLKEKMELTPIIFITGHGDISLSVKAMKRGAVDFLAKPFEGKDLIAAIGQAVEKDLARLKEEQGQKAILNQISVLTPREHEVMRWVITGMLNKQIAAEIGTTEKTVKVHRGQVMKKLQAESVADLVRLTQKAGIAPASS